MVAEAERRSRRERSKPVPIYDVNAVSQAQSARKSKKDADTQEDHEEERESEEESSDEEGDEEFKETPKKSKASKGKAKAVKGKGKAVAVVTLKAKSAAAASSASKKSAGKAAAAQQTADDASESEDEDEGDHDDDDPEFKTATKRKRGGGKAAAGSAKKAKVSGSASPSAKKAATAASKKKAAGAGSGKAKGKGKKGTDNTLFEAAKRSSAVVAVVDDWVASYSQDEAKAMQEALGFIFASVGAKPPPLASFTDLTDEKMDELLEEVQAELERESGGGGDGGAAAATATGGGSDAAMLKLATKVPKKGEQFLKNYRQIWSRIVPACKHGNKYNEELLTDLVEKLQTVSQSKVPLLRSAGCIALAELGASMVRERVELGNKLKTAKAQISSLKSKGTSTASRVRALEAQETTLINSSQALDQDIGNIMSDMLLTRYRDVQESIRCEIMHALGNWMLVDPSAFVKDMYVKHFGWTLSDRKAPVRQAAVDTLLKLYTFEDGKLLPALESFTMKFTPRLVEMVRDIDGEVATTVLKLLRAALNGDLLNKIEDEQAEAVEGAVFDADLPLEGRSEALGFYMDRLEVFDSDHMATGADGDDDAAAGSGGSSKGGSKGGGGGSSSRGQKQKQQQQQQQQQAKAKGKKTSQTSEKAEVWATSRLQALLELVTIHAVDENEPDSERTDEDAALANVHSLVQAMWPLPQAEVLKDWSAMLSFLGQQDDNGGGGGGDDEDDVGLNPAEKGVLVAILRESARLLLEDAEGGGGAKGKGRGGGGGGGGGGKAKDAEAKREEGREALSRLSSCLLDKLPDLLVQFGSDEKRLSLLVSLTNYLVPQELAQAKNKSSFLRLLGETKGMFLRATEDETLLAATKALANMLSMEHGQKAEVEEVIIAVLEEVKDKVMQLCPDVDSTTTPEDWDADEEFALSLALKRLKFALQWLDPVDRIDLADLCAVVSPALVYHADLDYLAKDEEGESLQVGRVVLENGVSALFEMTAWLVNNIFSAVQEKDRQCKQRKGDNTDDEDGVEEEGEEEEAEEEEEEDEEAREDDDGKGKKGKGKGKGKAGKKAGKQAGKKAQKKTPAKGGKKGTKRAAAGKKSGGAEKGKEGGSAKDDGFIDEDDVEINSKIEMAIQARDALVNALGAVLRMHLVHAPKEGDDDDEEELVRVLTDEQQQMVQAVQRDAYSLANELRHLLKPKLDNFAYVHRLVWCPDQPFFELIHLHYDDQAERLAEEVQELKKLSEGKSTKHQSAKKKKTKKRKRKGAEEDDDDDEEGGGGDEEEEEEEDADAAFEREQEKKVLEKKIEDTTKHLLLPLIKAQTANIGDKLEKRQAASVMSHFVNSGPFAAELVRMFTDVLKKHAGMARYLEVQMVTLQMFFSEYVSGPLTDAKEEAEEEQEEEEEEDEEDEDEEGAGKGARGRKSGGSSGRRKGVLRKLEEVVEKGMKRWLPLALRLSQSLGNGPLEGERAQEAFLRFMLQGVKMSLQAADSLGGFNFLAGLRYYVRSKKLTAAQRQRVAEEFDGWVAHFSDETKKEYSHYKALLEEKEKEKGGGGGAGGGKRGAAKKKGSAATTPKKGKKGAKAAPKKKKTKGKRGGGGGDDDDDEEDEDEEEEDEYKEGGDDEEEEEGEGSGGKQHHTHIPNGWRHMIAFRQDLKISRTVQRSASAMSASAMLRSPGARSTISSIAGVGHTPTASRGSRTPGSAVREMDDDDVGGDYDFGGGGGGGSSSGGGAKRASPASSAFDMGGRGGGGSAVKRRKKSFEADPSQSSRRSVGGRGSRGLSLVSEKAGVRTSFSPLKEGEEEEEEEEENEEGEENEEKEKAAAGGEEEEDEEEEEMSAKHNAKAKATTKGKGKGKSKAVELPAGRKAGSSKRARDEEEQEEEAQGEPEEEQEEEEEELEKEEEEEPKSARGKGKGKGKGKQSTKQAEVVQVQSRVVKKQKLVYVAHEDLGELGSDAEDLFDDLGE